MILDLTKTEELCKKLREVTGKSISISYELFFYDTGKEKNEANLWIEDSGVKRIASIEKLNAWLEYTIEYQQKTKELTND